MLITKTVNTKWNSKTKSYYEALGYEFTKMFDNLEVKVEHLKPYSREKVWVQCDYCGIQYEIEYQKLYPNLQEDNLVKKIACKKCCELKAVEILQKKYGVTNIGELAQTPQTKEKIQQTNLKNYGVKNVFSSVEIQTKIKNTCLKKYGVEYCASVPEIKEKIKNSCLEKYGVSCYLNLDFSGEKIRGENNPRWKGGVPRERSDINSWEYKEWRKSVFDRDSYTCQKCGGKQGKNKQSIYLNAHHIFNYKDYPDKRIELENGITLCDKCHLEFHSKYGKRHNTLEQLNEFLQNNK